MSNNSSLQQGYKAQALLITALTNMHVGSGKNDYGIVDNLVQRDVLSGWPTINSSSLKGALRQYCRAYWEADATNHVFGADNTAQNNSKEGAYIFMPGQLLSMPVRSNVQPFFRMSCAQALNDFLQLGQQLGAERPQLDDLTDSTEGRAAYAGAANWTEAILEDTTLSFDALPESEGLKTLLGDELVFVSNSVFTKLCNQEHLPVQARNSLENGVSKNLWYEQLVARQTRFVTYVLYPTGDQHATEFFKKLQEKPVQIGANASIGYGYCELQLL